ncbi:hypothetical protein [Paenibacillus sp. 1_12]|uniref:hypothetical protein n=1 Tax=Paenibacillus sp. 1_12 TaxID=1566278 RepID=UPI00116025FD|nr:hypothetical protein [Paenibacillus sp. 1_12]
MPESLRAAFENGLSPLSLITITHFQERPQASSTARSRSMAIKHPLTLTNANSKTIHQPR